MLVDRYGVLYLPRQHISIEIWVHTGDQLYTPNNYDIFSKNPVRISH